MSQKYLFIDRDGTLISEPPSDFQVDRFDKLAFEPGVIRSCWKLQKRAIGDDHQSGWSGSTKFPAGGFRWPGTT